MYSKADIYNLALGALLLTQRVTDPATDRSNQCAVLNTHWNMAYYGALKEMNLDSTSTQVPLQLVATFVSYNNGGYLSDTPVGLNSPWQYAYLYPQNCAFFRRIVSGIAKDSASTAIDKKVGIYQGQKVIFTNQEQAYAEIIDTTVPLSTLSSGAAMAIALRLAELSAPLITGKGAKALRDDLAMRYKVAMAEAQGQDQDENFNFEDDATQSEFVLARMS